MNRSEYPVIVDGHRSCAYCEQLERVPWSGVLTEQPWLCPMCRSRSMTDANFAHRVAQQLYYQCMELEAPTTLAAVDAALAALQGRWALLPTVVTGSVTQQEETVPLELDDDDRPF